MKNSYGGFGLFNMGKKDDIVCLIGEEKWLDVFYFYGGVNYRKWVEIVID